MDDRSDREPDATTGLEHGGGPREGLRRGRYRRWLLGAVGTALGAALAGCAGSGGGDDGGDTGDGSDDGDGTTTDPDGEGAGAQSTTDADTSGGGSSTPGDATDGGPTGGSTTGDGQTGGEGETTGDGTTTAGELDLRESNVTGVEFEDRGGGDYRFSVTLIHDDDGEEGYANWWQVETLEGERLGRRTLLHAHGTREFTRSETISVPEGVGTVVVRGHDRTHGYGGQVAVVDLGTGTVEFVRQGSEPDDLPRPP